jgi:hypothetical protein
MSVAKSPRVVKPIAVRRYTVEGEPDREVVLALGKPRPYRGSASEWVCPVRIEGLPKPKRRLIHGIDALQALQLAVEYARRTLDRSGLRLLWLPGGEPGDAGIPLPVPTAWGFAFQQRLERIVQQEVKRVTAIMVPILRERARRARASDDQT